MELNIFRQKKSWIQKYCINTVTSTLVYINVEDAFPAEISKEIGNFLALSEWLGWLCMC